ncbi:hypothetical protein [Saccharopolyspora dendranthemae]|uniref:Excreted virulence factor EspC (Type VII ESX diderm) n=1 Tax=Saccharopolyspora dendranthemae TaxID=1181886 RepID=A0A561V9P6_9PSEU|nr:hypothetical protein [Saccharopolyspora dendranthemae]TWG08345.1 hypothetical protein FHU35_11964 [Saccharopolyspora dendranthemae]
MADGYRVNMEKLTRLVNDLDRAADDITDANNKFGNASGRDLGSPGIDNAAEDFRNRWQDGITKIAEGAKKTSDALDGARSTYAKIENEAASLVAEAAEEPPPQQAASASAQPSRIEQRLNG